MSIGLKNTKEKRNHIFKVVNNLVTNAKKVYKYCVEKPPREDGIVELALTELLQEEVFLLQKMSFSFTYYFNLTEYFVVGGT